MKGVRERFDAFLIEEGVYEEWYRRMRECLPKEEQSTIFEDEPVDWLYEGFGWGEGFSDREEMMEDIRKWAKLADKWAIRYAGISN